MPSSTLAPAKRSEGLIKYNDRLGHWLSAVHAVLPADWAPRPFANTATLTRRIAMLEKVLEHIITLTNELNTRVDPGRASLPIPRSVFEVYGERKEQQKQVIARMKRLLDVTDIVNFTTAETLEAAHTRILDLKRETRDPTVGLSETQATPARRQMDVRRTQRALRVARGASRVSALLPRPVNASHGIVATPDALVKEGTIVPSSGVVNRTTASQQSRFRAPLPPTLDSYRAIQPLPEGATRARGFCAGEEGEVSVASTVYRSPAARVGPCALPSIKYVLKWEALGEIDRLAQEIRDFEISENLTRSRRSIEGASLVHLT